MYVQELAEQGSSKPQDNTELLALKDHVSKLTAEKAALAEKLKKSSNEKRGQYLPLTSSLLVLCIWYL